MDVAVAKGIPKASTTDDLPKSSLATSVHLLNDPHVGIRSDIPEINREAAQHYQNVST
jgi:hypothetical protein